MSIFTTSKDVTISFEEYDRLHYRITSLQRDNQEYVRVINEQQKFIENLQQEKQQITHQIEQYQMIQEQNTRNLREISKRALTVAKNFMNEDKDELFRTIEQKKCKIEQQKLQITHLQEVSDKIHITQDDNLLKMKKDLSSLQMKYSILKRKLSEKETLEAKQRSQIKMLSDENISLLERYDKLLEQNNALFQHQYGSN